jgi:UDPglucose 6-dehydrogenase
LKGKQIGLLGLTFKPNTDDLRDAPALDVADRLLAQGANLRGFDPVGMPGAAKINPSIEMVEDPYQLAEGSDALIVCTEWNEFKHLDMVRIRDLMKQAVIVDGRNIYDPVEMDALGFTYRGIGRGYGSDGNPIANHNGG